MLAKDKIFGNRKCLQLEEYWPVLGLWLCADILRVESKNTGHCPIRIQFFICFLKFMCKTLNNDQQRKS